MRFTTLARARESIRAAYTECDSETLREVINAIRQDWYSWYAQTPLFEIEECFELQNFCGDCGSHGYTGVTLPRDYASVSHIWHDSSPWVMNGRWRGWHDGISLFRDCGLTHCDMGENFASERDLFPHRPAKLRFNALDPADAGKTIIIRGESVFGPYEKTFTLSVEPQETEVVIKTLTGFQKEVTKGRVVLADHHGRVLSIYSPKEVLAGYKRIRISGVPSHCGHVNIRGPRQHVELFDDNDVVETGNLRAWELMARGLRLSRKAEPSAGDLNAAEKYFGACRGLLLGDKSRSKGKTQPSSIAFEVGSMPCGARLSY